MSVFIDCFKNNGIDYLRIVDGKRFKKEDGTITNKRKIIKNLGPLKKFDDGQGEGLLLRVREKFKNRTLDIDIKYEDIITKVSDSKPFIKNPKETIDTKNIGYFFLDNLFNKLGISEVLTKTKSDSKLEYDLLGLTKLLVFGRILNPASKKRTFENKDDYLFPVTTSKKEKEIYRTLDILDKKAKTIQTRMNTKIKQSSVGRNTDITYYDVTNYFFETMYGDDDTFLLDEEGNKILNAKNKPIIIEKGLRKKGVCKNNTPNPLVAMGLFIDNNGLPVSYDIFPGNTQDKTTFKEVIKKSINVNDLGRIIVVADNGMYAQENMYLLVDKGNGYIISKAAKKHWTTKPTKLEEISLRDWALDDNGYDCKIKNNEITFKSKSRVYDRVLKDSNGDAVTIKEKQIIFWSKKHYDKELHQNEKFIEYLESCKEHPDKLKDKQRKSQEFIKVVQTDKKTGEVLKTKPLVIFLEDKIKKYKETLGYYSIVTSEIDMPNNEVIDRYHGLSRIEDSFRIIKSDLKGRPIFVWTEEHINAHFLICFIALTIMRLMQYKVLKHLGEDTLNIDGWKQGITAEKIKKSLNGFEANLIGDGYYQLSKYNDNIETIMKSIGIKNELILPDATAIAGLKDKIASVRL